MRCQFEFSIRDSKGDSYVGLALVSIAAFAMTFLFWSSRLPENDHNLVGFLAIFNFLLGPLFGVVELLFLIPLLPDAYVTMTIPLMIPAVVCPWLTALFGCAYGDMLRIERRKKRQRKDLP